MKFKFPKDDGRHHWTNHVKRKMLQYRISEALVRRIIKSPKRTEAGIASQTVAVMQRAPSKKLQEIWVMYKATKNCLRIISAWRYPGVSPIGKPIPIPTDILEELENYAK